MVDVLRIFSIKTCRRAGDRTLQSYAHFIASVSPPSHPRFFTEEGMAQGSIRCFAGNTATQECNIVAIDPKWRNSLGVPSNGITCVQSQAPWQSDQTSNHHIHKSVNLTERLPMFKCEPYSIAQLDYEYTMARDPAACASKNYEKETVKLAHLSLREFRNKTSLRSSVSTRNLLKELGSRLNIAYYGTW